MKIKVATQFGTFEVSMPYEIILRTMFNTLKRSFIKVFQSWEHIFNHLKKTKQLNTSQFIPIGKKISIESSTQFYDSLILAVTRS